MIKTWSDQQERDLKALLNEGKSTAQIGKIIGKSKNAVIGKIGRMGLRASGKAKEKPEFKEPKVIRPHGSIPLNDIGQNECRFMGGGHDDKLCCGKPIYKWSMCEEHYNICCDMPKDHKGYTTKDKFGKVYED